MERSAPDGSSDGSSAMLSGTLPDHAIDLKLSTLVELGAATGRVDGFDSEPALVCRRVAMASRGSQASQRDGAIDAERRCRKRVRRARALAPLTSKTSIYPCVASFPLRRARPRPSALQRLSETLRSLRRDAPFAWLLSVVWGLRPRGRIRGRCCPFARALRRRSESDRPLPAARSARRCRCHGRTARPVAD